MQSVASGCPPEADDKSLLLQSQGPELELTWRSLPLGLAFMQPDSTMQASKEGAASSLHGAYGPHQLPARNSNSMGDAMAPIPWQWLTALWLNLRPAQQEVNHAWYWRLSQLCRTCDIIDFGEKSTATTLLKQHNFLTILFIILWLFFNYNLILYVSPSLDLIFFQFFKSNIYLNLFSVTDSNVISLSLNCSLANPYILISNNFLLIWVLLNCSF